MHESSTYPGILQCLLVRRAIEGRCDTLIDEANKVFEQEVLDVISRGSGTCAVLLYVPSEEMFVLATINLHLWFQWLWVD